jgi:multiple antibiotic resistance protein
MLFEHKAVVLFLALFALYSPVAALSSYLPIVRPYSHPQQLRLAMGLVVNVAVFVLLAIWVGEPLLKLLGISTAALTATGGIALLYASIPLMRGVGEAPSTDDNDTSDPPEPAAEAGSPRSVLFTPSPSP